MHPRAGKEIGGRRKTYINRQVLPQAPSPTMTSFRRSSADIVAVPERGSYAGEAEGWRCWGKTDFGRAGFEEDVKSTLQMSKCENGR